MDIGKEQLLELYRTMQRLRQFDSMVRDLTLSAQIPGFTHVSLGEEAIAAGVGAVLRTTDKVTSTHRAHAHFLAKGSRLDRAMAEIMGKATGYCKGKSGEMHLSDPANGFICANGIVGGGLPVATGLALAAKMQGRDDVAVCFFGDGAANQGTFHESLNLAAIWKLPIMYVCENNGFGQWSASTKTTSVEDIASRAQGYGMPGAIVDGNDVFDVYARASESVARARAGDGPTLLECKTYRWEGHVVGENKFLKEEYYRTNREIDDWKQRCPLLRFEQLVVAEKKLTRAELEQIAAEVAEEVNAAVEFGKASPLPDPADATRDVYA
ncbi:MAG: thiamine pyrophosphate-dependent dehydrogenase E1 component subunit alpha [Candidatus Binatia bacterium]